jgi:hypothetical protein
MILSSFSSWPSLLRNPKIKISIFLLLFSFTYFWQRDRNHEFAHLVKVKVIDGKINKDSWVKVNERLKLNYLIKFNKSHDRLKIFLPLKGTTETNAILQYGIEGENEVSFPLAKLPNLAEYVFVLPSMKKRLEIPFFIRFDFTDDYPVYFSKDFERMIKVEGQDGEFQELPKNAVIPRSHFYYKTTEQCEGVRK